MTPDKVEAALGVLESARRALCSQDLREVLMNVQNNINSPACAGMANAALVRMDRLPDLHEALSTLTSALAERGWRPIESVPDFGSFLVVVGGSVFSAYNTGNGMKNDSTHQPFIGAATHWQPLPEPPHAR